MRALSLRPRILAGISVALLAVLGVTYALVPSVTGVVPTGNMPPWMPAPVVAAPSPAKNHEPCLPSQVGAGHYGLRNIAALGIPGDCPELHVSGSPSHATPTSTSTTGSGTVPTTDWSKAVVESTMDQLTPESLGGWNYTRGLYLWGQYLVFKRTGDPKYLAYIRKWADRFVDSDGSIDQGFSNLDAMQSGNVLIALFRETGDAKYRTAADKIRKRLDTYPRTRDGGWWHSTSDSRRNQLWGDGVFMVLPFLARYGQTFGDSDGFASKETAQQLEVYFTHLRDNQTNLLRHAYNQDKDTPWADKETGQSPESWCRAMGWFGMATTEVLEVLPATHPRRQALIDIIRFLAVGWERHQDPASGRWFQVVNRGDQEGNWTETSCSSMYTYVLSRGVERNYIDAHYRDVASKGWRGVLQRISKSSDGRTNLTEICIGTNVGNDFDFYRKRPREANDFHGLGAFLIMQEQMMRVGG